MLMALYYAHAVSILRHVVNEGLFELLSKGLPLFVFDMFFCDERGFGNLMFPLWFVLLGGSFVFLDMGPSILFLVFPLFWCFDLFMVGKVSSFWYELNCFRIRKHVTCN